MQRQNWVQWEEVGRGSFLIILEPILPTQEKLVHEVESSLPEDIIKRDCLVRVWQRKLICWIVMAFGLWLILQGHPPSPRSQGTIQKSVGFWEGGEAFVGQFIVTVLGALLPSGSHVLRPLLVLSKWFFMYMWLMSPVEQEGHLVQVQVYLSLQSIVLAFCLFSLLSGSSHCHPVSLLSQV